SSCGIITGLVLFFLSNIRANQMSKLNKEYSVLKKMDNTLRDIAHYGLYYQIYKALWGEKHDVWEDSTTIITLLDEVEQMRNDIPNKLWESLGFCDFDPLDHDNINQMKDGLECCLDKESARKWIIKVSEEMTNISDKLHQPIIVREDQIALLNKLFI
ncbi:MAG: hypothetical protein J6B02_05330, partial [Selenomonadales bacterium]|nr:hypothetical protein [Selenomonadales bacterium]